jgi:hypothetical protein
MPRGGSRPCARASGEKAAARRLSHFLLRVILQHTVAGDEILLERQDARDVVRAQGQIFHDDAGEDSLRLQERQTFQRLRDAVQVFLLDRHADGVHHRQVTQRASHHGAQLPQARKLELEGHHGLLELRRQIEIGRTQHQRAPVPAEAPGDVPEGAHDDRILQVSVEVEHQVDAFGAHRGHELQRLDGRLALVDRLSGSEAGKTLRGLPHVARHPQLRGRALHEPDDPALLKRPDADQGVAGQDEQLEVPQVFHAGGKLRLRGWRRKRPRGI